MKFSSMAAAFVCVIQFIVFAGYGYGADQTASSPASTSAPAMSPAQVLASFDEFCAANFGALKEELTYKLPGQDFKVIDDGAWQHISENSACIAWETNLPSKAYIEYGLTKDYGSKTDAPPRAFYLHIQTITGLKTGTAYHYRTVSTDERGKKIVSDDKTFTTTNDPKAIRIPGNLGKPPYDLKTAGATYVLTEDIFAPGTAFNILARDITLDLNGHTVTYNEDASVKPLLKEGYSTYGEIGATGEHGVRCSYGARGKTRLLNGTIVQGRGNGGYGYTPVSFMGSEVAGVTVVYHGPQVDGICGEGSLVHHNIVIDCGTELTNRHQGVNGFNIGKGVCDLNHNLIRRVRHRGISMPTQNSKVGHNEIYIDSCATNSQGIFCYNVKGGEVYGNRVFGTGYLAIGIMTYQQCVDVKVHDNFVHMQARSPDSRWKEYGEQSGAYCVRVHQGGDKVVYENNVLVSNGRDGGMVRGVWFIPYPKMVDVVFRKNTIKATAQNEQTDKQAAVVVDGFAESTYGGVFEDNTIISNFCNVKLGDDYGTGLLTRFVRNTFVRTGDLKRYRTFQCGFWTFKNTGCAFVDSVFENGAGYDKYLFDGSAENDFIVAWTVTVKTAPDAAVKAVDSTGKETSAKADDKGVAMLELVQYVHKGNAKSNEKSARGPYTVTATAGEKSASKKIDIEKPLTLDLPVAN